MNTADTPDATTAQLALLDQIAAAAIADLTDSDLGTSITNPATSAAATTATNQRSTLGPIPERIDTPNPDSDETPASIESIDPQRHDRNKGRLWALAAAIVLLIAGAVVGYAIARADDPQPITGPVGTTEEGSALVGSAQYSGVLAASRDSALLLSESNGDMKFGHLKSDGLLMSTAAAVPNSLLLDAIESRSGDWLAVTATCMEESGGPCSDQTVYRVSEDMKRAHVVSLGSVAATDRLRVVAVSDSGTFAIESVSDTLVQLGRVNPSSASVDWFWKSDPFDMAAIRAAANESQTFQFARPPLIDMCASGDRFIWRWAVGAIPPTGWEVGVEGRTIHEKWVPDFAEAADFACTAEMFITANVPGAGGIERLTTAIDIPAGQEPQWTHSGLVGDQIGGADLRPGGGIIAEVGSFGTQPTPSDGTVPAPPNGEASPTSVLSAGSRTTVSYLPPDGSTWRTILDGAVKGQPVVTDEGELIGLDLFGVVKPAG